MMTDRNKKILIIVSLILFALSIRLFPPLDRHGLNMMEIDYINWGKNLKGYEFISNSIVNHHGLISPYIIKFWLNLPVIKNYDFHTRLLSIIFFFILIGLVLLLTYRDLTFKERVISGFFLSINCMLVAFSRNGRLLPLFALLVFIIAIYLYRNLIEPDKKNAVLLFVFSTLSLFNHPLSTIFITSIVISAVLVFGINKSFIKGILPLIISGLFYLPIFIWYIQYGRTENELLPIDKKIILSWIVFLFDDIDTLLIIAFLLPISKAMRDIKSNIVEIGQNRFVRFMVLNVFTGLLLIITISIFLPLTRQYYIIPLVVFSSIVMGALSSRMNNRVLIALILILSIKAVISFCIADKNIFRFESSFGPEKEVLNRFRNSDAYKNIQRDKAVFINLPLYHTRAFDYYKETGERHLPEMNKFADYEEVLNPTQIASLKDENSIYLIQWRECNKLMDLYQQKLCNINFNILKTQFNRWEMIWEYKHKLGFTTKMYHLKN